MSKPPGGGEGRQADTLVKSSVSRGTANAVSALCVCVCVHARAACSVQGTPEMLEGWASRREEARMVRGWGQG